MCPLMSEQSNQWIIFHVGDREVRLSAVSKGGRAQGKEAEIKARLFKSYFLLPHPHVLVLLEDADTLMCHSHFAEP